MMKKLYVKLSFLLVILILGCSPLSKMKSDVKGMSISEVVIMYGKPDAKYLDKQNNWVYVYNKFKRLKSQPITGGNFHATQISIPSTTRIDHYNIHFNSDQKVQKVTVESEYN
ncbi:hypothetical protein K4L44_01455 [Halosquirtibacter laminarini]|uniref:Uncharacterized protein n=1 Tax=Halosquirtibacter laminarini TaxID=3374600 RepID=A0AC61NL45_9BACT|nr:hypothetical protein K4L44_01455 [Prolixibacteraceae bacterium]